MFRRAKDIKMDVTLDMGHGGKQIVKLFYMKKKQVDLVFLDHPCFHRPGNPYGDARGTFKDNTFRYYLSKESLKLIQICVDEYGGV